MHAKLLAAVAISPTTAVSGTLVGLIELHSTAGSPTRPLAGGALALHEHVTVPGMWYCEPATSQVPGYHM